MASQPVSTPDVPSMPLTNSESAKVGNGSRRLEFRPRGATHGEGHSGQRALEPGEIRTVQVKDEPMAGNPFLEYQLDSNERGRENVSRSPFAHDAAAAGPSTPSTQHRQRSTPIERTPFGPPQPMNAVQRRNHARMAAMVTRLENYDGSVPEMLTVANIQHQLDIAFADLDRAKVQLKQVLHQFELEGCITDRQSQKRNSAAKDLNSSSQRIARLSKDLCKLLRHN
ncbi:hypothetical protein F4861DRAFT_390473 [Xylaria intraflava]|nr:hypothetical protein F4861DRAFT_390473 [Xylaria intraflava]